MRRPRGRLGLVGLAAIGAIAGAAALLAIRPAAPDGEGAPAAAPARADVVTASPAVAARPAWTPVAWPFPADPWGKGKAYRCRAEHCGAEILVYLRAKIGMCGCITSIDDDGVERGSDLDLVATDRRSLGPGRAIDVRWMKGRSRLYALAPDGAPPRTAVAVAFHDRCDMVVATATVDAAEVARHEPAVIDLLNSDPVMRWAEVTLGL